MNLLDRRLPADAYKVVVTVLGNQRLVTVSKKRGLRGEKLIESATAGDFDEHEYFYHIPQDMLNTRLYIVYVKTQEACQFFLDRGFDWKSRDAAARLFAERNRQYSIGIDDGHIDGVRRITSRVHDIEYDVDHVYGSDHHTQPALLHHEPDEADGADDPGLMNSDDVLADLDDNFVDFDATEVDTVDAGAMSWSTFMSFTLPVWVSSRFTVFLSSKIITAAIGCSGRAHNFRVLKQTRVFCGTIPIDMAGIEGRLTWCDCPNSSLHFGRANAMHRPEYVDWMRQERERPMSDHCIHQQMLLGAVAAAVGVQFISSDISFPGARVQRQVDNNAFATCFCLSLGLCVFGF